MNRILTLAMILSLALPVAGMAQKKKTIRRPAEPTPKPVMVDMRPEAQMVGTQIKNLSKFLFVYGKITNGLEVAEDQAKQGQSSPALAARTKQTKDALVTNMTNLRAGIDALSKTFKANPRLQVQYLKISYATEAAVSAEQMAAAGKYDEAGKMLTTVIERLTDAMLSMRLL